MARRCREFDWDRTALGSPAEWNPALRVAVRTVLESPFAMNLWCGPQLVLIYNDAYRPALGAKHSVDGNAGWRARVCQQSHCNLLRPTA